MEKGLECLGLGVRGRGSGETVRLGPQGAVAGERQGPASGGTGGGRERQVDSRDNPEVETQVGGLDWMSQVRGKEESSRAPGFLT